MNLICFTEKEYLCGRLMQAEIAQLVEQRIRNA